MLFPQVFAEMFTSDSALLGLLIQHSGLLCLPAAFGNPDRMPDGIYIIRKAKASIAVAVTRKFILLLPLIYLLPHILTGNKTNAVYMAETDCRLPGCILHDSFVYVSV